MLVCVYYCPPEESPDARLKAPCAVQRIWPPTASSWRPASRPLCIRKGVGLRYVSLTRIHNDYIQDNFISTSSRQPATPPVTLMHLRCCTTFDVNPGQNVLERSGMQQVTHFLLRLRTHTHGNRNETFRSTNAPAAALSHSQSCDECVSPP